MSGTFRPFGPDHLLALGGLTVVIGAMIAFATALRRAADDRPLRLGLCALMIAAELTAWISALARGDVVWPCQLCDLALFLMIWALLGRQRVVGEVACLWGLAGSLQAILTPDLERGFPSLRWLTFFGAHGGVVIGAVYLLVRGRLRLTAASVWRVWGISNGYLAIAGGLNWWLGTNYGYLARKPAQPSLLDYLGPWPYYLLSMELVALALFAMVARLAQQIDRWAMRPHTS